MTPARQARTIVKGLGFLEGPVFDGDGTLYVTSITQGGLYRIRSDDTVELIDIGDGGNGATAGSDGSLFIAQNGGRRLSAGPVHPPARAGVQRVDPAGRLTWISEDPISPNDLRFGPDGLLYVTDPTRTPQMDDGRIWRIDPETGASEILVSVHWYPNGLAFDADDVLWVADTRDAIIHRGVIDDDGRLGPLEPVIRMQNGNPDGIAFDAAGNLLVCALDMDGGVGTLQTWTPGGELVDVFSLGRGGYCTNVAFGPTGSLVVTYGDLEEVVEISDWGIGGLPPHPFRERRA